MENHVFLAACSVIFQALVFPHDVFEWNVSLWKIKGSAHLNHAYVWFKNVTHFHCYAKWRETRWKRKRNDFCNHFSDFINHVCGKLKLKKGFHNSFACYSEILSQHFCPLLIQYICMGACVKTITKERMCTWYSLTLLLTDNKATLHINILHVVTCVCLQN